MADVTKMVPKYNFRDTLKDEITGFTGQVVCIALYDTGCIHYSLQSKKMKADGVPNEWQSFDETRFKLIKKSEVKVEKPHSGPVPKIRGI
jgi:hypothetical protein